MHAVVKARITYFHSICFEAAVISEENEPRIGFLRISMALTRASISCSYHLGERFLTGKFSLDCRLPLTANDGKPFARSTAKKRGEPAVLHQKALYFMISQISYGEETHSLDFASILMLSWLSGRRSTNALTKS